jgi:MoaA/NifB/PqqE/SkfB family radical SAM enzyme
MIERLLKRMVGREKSKPFSAWQVELTTRCPLRCRMCVRAETDDWMARDMSFDTFQRILPYLKDVETVVLEGWGESLLHRNLVECIRLVKNEGSEVGFVTSATGLTKNRISDLVEAGLDFVGLSLAGTSAATHDAIRVNSHLPEVLHAARLLAEEKARRRLTRPRIHLVFLMLKDNIHEVPSVPSLAKEIGIGEVVFTNICHAINSWQEEQRVFLWERGENTYERFLKKAEANARSLRIKVSRPSLSASDVSVCSENPLRNLYISAEGEVSPCVYLYPSLPSPFRRIFCGKEYRIDKVGFGNIARNPFSTIWTNPAYLNFRDCFEGRKNKFGEIYRSLWGGVQAGDLEGATLPPPPDACKTCHKILGV